jgi:putative addiction module antidote
VGSHSGLVDRGQLRSHSGLVDRGQLISYNFCGNIKISKIESIPKMLLNIKKRGNSLSIIVPKEMATSMNVEDGDILFATKTPSGYEISAYEPSFAAKMEAARQGMKKYRNALIELAR